MTENGMTEQEIKASFQKDAQKTEQTGQTEQTQPNKEDLGGYEWLDLEEDELNTNNPGDYEKKESLKLVEKKITEIKVDFSKPFQKWTGSNSTGGGSVTKAIIPVVHEGIEKNWWLNVKNPVYKEIIHKGKEGISFFRIMQIGNQQNTKYELVED